MRWWRQFTWWIYDSVVQMILRNSFEKRHIKYLAGWFVSFNWMWARILLFADTALGSPRKSEKWYGPSPPGFFRACTAHLLQVNGISGSCWVFHSISAIDSVNIGCVLRIFDVDVFWESSDGANSIQWTEHAQSIKCSLIHSENYYRSRNIHSYALWMHTVHARSTLTDEA